MGVQVQLMQRRVEEGRPVWRMMQTQQTNARGVYRFADLQAGDYKVLTREWTESGAGLPRGKGKTVGYPPVAYPRGTDLSTAGLVHVGAGETPEADMTLCSMPYFPVEIPVANLGTGVGVAVQVEDSEGGSGFSLAFDQRTGRVEGSLPVGLYRLILTSYGEQPRMAFANITVAGAVRGGPLTLTAGASLRVEVREEFSAAASKSQRAPQGVVFGGMGTPGQVPDQPMQRSVEVYLQPVEGEQRPGASLRTGGRGRRALNEELAVENIQPGSYWVRVMPYQGYVASATVGGQDVLRQPLVVAPDDGGAVLDVTLRDDTGTVSGMVSPVPSVGELGASGTFPSVWCFPMDGKQPTVGIVDSQGHFQAGPLPPGRYLLLPTETGMQDVEYRDETVMKRLMAEGTVVTVASGENATARVQMVPRPVRVRDETAMGVGAAAGVCQNGARPNEPGRRGGKFSNCREGGERA